MKKLAITAALAALFAVPMVAQAESTFVTGAAATTASARLDFQVVIPKVLYVRVGTGSNLASNGTIDLIDFQVPAANIGDGTAVAATAGSGDLGTGGVTVRVFGNNGNISLNSATSGPLSNGAGDSIAWSQIAVTGAALGATSPGYTNGAITHPTFNTGATGGNGTATTLTATGKIVRQEGRWNYAYNNTTGVIPAGTYGATAVNNGRVTYTVTQP